jgi:hypothetical protein
MEGVHMRTVRMLTLAALSAGLFLLPGATAPHIVSGQQTSQGTNPGEHVTQVLAGQLGQYDWTQAWGQQFGLYQKANDLAQRYVKTEKDSEKTAVRKELTDVLKQQFEEHMKHQEQEVKKLEEQIKELRKTLDRRRDAKDKIIERRFEQLVDNAQGLGWGPPGSWYMGAFPEGNFNYFKSFDQKPSRDSKKQQQ